MVTFELVLNPASGLYAVYENGIKVKHDIFSGLEDFKQELVALGFNKPYTVKVVSE